MAKSTRKKEKISKEEKTTTVVMFESYISAYEVAEILINKVTKLCMESKEMSHIFAEGSFDITSLAGFLEHNIDSDALNEFMVSQFGQGLLIGLYLSYMDQQEREAIVEEEYV